MYLIGGIYDTSVPIHYNCAAQALSTPYDVVFGEPEVEP
jgi:hypothetical protein